ncbi:23S rRNA (guanosine(2251)-2'-O)-methyltransferase RlmB [Collinsella sp. zg1085]|nr:23S rRNA (guanosine(2251)-2'-O)-methyltransferase RlmB [Collinsella sp. zg1085]
MMGKLYSQGAGQVQRKVRDRDKSRLQGLYIEGRRAAEEALKLGFPVRRVLVAAGQESALALLMTGFQAAGVRVEICERHVLDELSSHGAHQGICLEIGEFPYADIADVLAASGTGASLVVVLDHVTDEGNLGAIIRSAEVVGAAGVVIAQKRAAGVGTGTFKTSAGAVMHLPVARVPNIAQALEALQEAGFWVVGASEHAHATCWDEPLTGRIALVMGSEGDGIARLIQERCDSLVKLPQRGQTESLNVAQAATVLCYEWLRTNAHELKIGE